MRRVCSGLSLLCVSLSVLIRRQEIDTVLTLSPSPLQPRWSPREHKQCVSNNESLLARVTPADNQFTGQERDRREAAGGDVQVNVSFILRSCRLHQKHLSPINISGDSSAFPGSLCCKITRMNLCMDHRISRNEWVHSDI